MPPLPKDKTALADGVTRLQAENTQAGTPSLIHVEPSHHPHLLSLCEVAAGDFAPT